MKLDNIDNNFVTYKKFNALIEANELISILEKNNIDYLIENSSPNYDITLSANHSQDEFRIRIHPDNFEKVNNLIISELKDLPDKTHFIHQFNENELFDVLKNPEEWSPEVLFFAKNILETKGILISEEQLETWKNQKIELLKKPLKKPNKLIQTAIFLNILGGFSGMLVGWYLQKFVRTLFNGERVNAYDEETRLIGANLFKSGLIIHLAFVILLISYNLLKGI